MGWRYPLASLWIVTVVVCGMPALTADSPFKFTDKVELVTAEDAAILEQTIAFALDGQPDGYVTQWQNPLTGSNGTLEVVTTHQGGDEYCRDLRLVQHAKGYTEQTSLRFCRQADNSWAMHSP